MNIFRVLSKGDGSVSEPNVTSVLTFLLDPTENHGMGSVFLECFLLKLAEESLLELNFKNFVVNNIKTRSSNSIQTSTDFQVSVDSEVRIERGKSKRDVDILIEIQKSSTNESYLLVIENKIKKTSIVKDQLKDIFSYYNMLEVNEKYNCISYLLLLPCSSENYKIDSSEFKKCFYDSFLNSVLENILNEESIGNLPPINNFTKLFIKSLKQFILNDFSFKENFNYSKVDSILIKDKNNKEIKFEGKGVLKKSVEYLLCMVVNNKLINKKNELKIGSYPAIKTTLEFKGYVEDSVKNYKVKKDIPSKKQNQIQGYSKRLKNRYSNFDTSYNINDKMFCTQITSSGHKPNIIQFIKDVKVLLSNHLDSVVLTDENGLNIDF